MWSLCGSAADSGQALLAGASAKISLRDFSGAQVILNRLLSQQPNLAEAHNLLGVCAAELGDPEAAASSFRKAIQLKPGYAGAYLNLASALLKIDRQGEALDAIKHAVALQPNILTTDPQAFTMNYLLGLDYAQHGEVRRAAELFQSSIRQKPNFTPARLALGKLLLAGKHEDGALKQFEAILAVDPNEPSALGNAALIYARRADYVRSIRYLGRAYELDQGNTALALALAEARIRAGQTSEADGLISQLQSAGRLTEETRRVLALVWLNCGHPEEGAALAGNEPPLAGEFRDAAVKQARQDFLHSNYRTAAGNLEVAKKMGAPGAEVHRLLGNCYYELDEPKQASDEFQAALRLDPDNEQSYFNLGMLYLKYRTPELATLVFEHGLKQLPNSALLWVGLGLSQHLAERTDQAESSLKKALELDPGLTDAYVVLGDILESANKLPDALEIFKSAIERKPDLYIGYFYYGKIILKMNESKPTEAVTALRRAIQLKPEFAEAHYELGRALEQTGDAAGAIAEYKESTLRDPALAGSQYRLALLYKKQGDAKRAELAMSAFKKAQAAEGRDTVMKKLEYRIGKD